MSQTSGSEKKYDGTTILTHEVFNNPNLLGKFISNLWCLLGRSEDEFERQKIGPTLETAAKAALLGLYQTSRRITGIASGSLSTPNAHSYNKGLTWVISPNHGKIAITDSGIIAMSLWNMTKTLSGDDQKVTDERAMHFMAKAAEAVIKTCGYTVDELKAFEANRD